MTQDPDISDETLTAFLDGELSADDHARVEDALQKHAGLSDRLSRLDLSVQSLRNGAADVLDLAPACPELPPVEASSRFPWAAGLAAAVAIFAIGFLMRPAADPNWVSAVANYQSLYVSETLERSEDPDQRAATLAMLSKTIDLDVAPLQMIDTINFRRAQILGFEGQPLLQVAYLDGDVPIAICIIQRPGEATQIQEETLFGMSSAYWQEGDHGFLVIGGEDPALIRQIAEQVQNLI